MYVLLAAIFLQGKIADSGLVQCIAKHHAFLVHGHMASMQGDENTVAPEMASRADWFPQNLPACSIDLPLPAHEEILYTVDGETPVSL
jgi:hypothetical protein